VIIVESYGLGRPSSAMFWVIGAHWTVAAGAVSIAIAAVSIPASRTTGASSSPPEQATIADISRAAPVKRYIIAFLRGFVNAK
jgi:hypothetical protein